MATPEQPTGAAARRLRMGMVGGGSESFSGFMHRMAAQMDGRIELVCGAFSHNRQKAFETGAALLLPPERVYGSYRDMMRREAKLPPDQKMDFVAVVTPNNMHYPVTMAAIDSGFHVICDKPMTTSMDEATNLVRKLKDTGRLFCVTNIYTGFAMVKEARALVMGRKLGNVRRVVVEHPQGWLAMRLETAGHKQAAWRMDPHRVGLSCCMSDIGVQAESLLSYVTGDEVSEVCADLHSFVKGRVLDDDGSVLLRMASGARGVLWASQITVGEDNDMRIRVYGERGTVEWSLRDADTLRIHWIDKPMEVRRAGTPFTSVPPNSPCRLPVGFSGGYIEPLANIYRAFAGALTKLLDSGKNAPAQFEYPTAQDGLRGVTFVDAVVASSKGPDKWIKVGEPRPPTPPKPPVEVEGF